MAIYTAKQGESFDSIARALWGGYAGAQTLYLLNPQFAGTLVFAGGERLLLPEENPQTVNSRPPWRQGGNI